MPAANATKFQRPATYACPHCDSHIWAAYNENIPFYLTEKQDNKGPGTFWVDSTTDIIVATVLPPSDTNVIRPGDPHDTRWFSLLTNWTVYCPSCGHTYRQGRPS